MRLHLHLLGGFRATLADGRVVSLRHRKVEAIAAYLGASREQVSRDVLAALLWGDRSDRRARHSLRQALLTFRVSVPPELSPALIVDGEIVGLDPALVQVDVLEFEEAAAAGTTDALSHAARLYRGDFLRGFKLHAENFEDWLRSERTRLHERAVEVFSSLLARHAETDATDAAIRTALQLLTLDPLQEATHRMLMSLYMRKGRRAAALYQYQLCVDLLQRELGVEPEDSTRALYEQMLIRPASSLPSPTGNLRTTAPRRRGGDKRRPRPRTNVPLIGRRAELKLLRRAVGEAFRKRGGVAMVIGEAGVGKTRLVEELQLLARGRRAYVLVGRAYETAQALALTLWVDALRSNRAAVAHAMEATSAWRVELARLFPELGPEPTETGADAIRLFQAILHLLQSLASRQPVMLVLEDVQWADELSVRLIGFVARHVPDSSLLVVATAREEEIADAAVLAQTIDELRQHSWSVIVSLLPLCRRETGDLVRALAGQSHAGGLDSVEEHVWKVSQGNPFAAVETMRALHQCRGPNDTATQPLADSIRRLVTSRLDRLSAQSRDIVAVAAVIGREFEFELLRRAADLNEAQATGGVEELVRRRILRSVGDRLDFTHDRVREVALGNLLPHQRKIAERRVGVAYEELYAGADVESVAIGNHYLRGGSWDKAVVYLRRAAAQAKTRFAFAQAVAFLEQALMAVSHLPTTPATLAVAIDIRFEVRDALYQLNEFGAVLRRIEEAAALATDLGDQQRLGRALVHLSAASWIVADWPKVRRFAEDADQLGSTNADLELQAQARYYRALAALAEGSYELGNEHLWSALRLLEGERATHDCGLIAPPAILCRSWLAWSLGECGEFEAAIVCGQEGIEIAEAIGRPFGRVHIYNNLAWTQIVRGDLSSATDLLALCRDLCREWNVVFLMRSITRRLGYLQVRRGNVIDGLQTLQQALALDESAGILATESLTLAQLAEAAAVAGRLEDSRRYAERALLTSRARRERGVEAWALRAMGDIAARESNAVAWNEAAVHYAAALAIASELRLRPFAAQCHLRIARLHRNPAMHAAMATAIDAFRTMGMTFDLARVTDSTSSTAE